MIQNAPTDNLYKFISISGLLIVGATTWLSYSFHGKALDEEAVVRGQAISLFSELEISLQRIGQSRAPEGTEVQTRVAVDEINGKFEYPQPGSMRSIIFNPQRRAEYRTSLAEWDGLLADWEFGHYSPADHEVVARLFPLERVQELRSMLRQHSVDVERLWLRQDDARTLRILAVLAWMTGIIAVPLGFGLWYNRVQFYLDQKLLWDVTRSMQAQHPEHGKQPDERELDLF